MIESTRQSRRQIIKSFTLLSAASMLMGKKWLTDVVAQISPTAQSGGVLQLTLSDFPVLSQTGGSVRIGTSGLVATEPGCDQSVGLYAPVLINRGAGGQYFALSASCTHEGCTVPIYSASLGFSQCPRHGSRFGIDGRLIRGPAGAPLPSYTVRPGSPGTLVVEIPDMTFDLTTASVIASGTPRLSLKFLAFSGIEYEVQSRTTLASNWTTVPFSLTPTGPADETFLAGNSDEVTIYVDRAGASSFFAVVMRTQEV